MLSMFDDHTTENRISVIGSGTWTVGEMIIAPAFPSCVREISPLLLVRNMGVFSGGVNAGLLPAPIAYGLMQNTVVPGGVWTLSGGLLVFVTKLRPPDPAPAASRPDAELSQE